MVLSLIEKDTFKSCVAQQVGDARSHYNRKGSLDKVVTHINEQVVLSIYRLHYREMIALHFPDGIVEKK